MIQNTMLVIAPTQWVQAAVAQDFSCNYSVNKMYGSLYMSLHNDLDILVNGLIIT